MTILTPPRTPGIPGTPGTPRIPASLAALAALAIAAIVVLGGCEKKSEPPVTPPVAPDPAAVTPDTPGSPDPDVAEAEVDEPQKRRKTSIIGAPIQKAEDIRDLVGKQQQDLLDQIDGK